MNITKIITTAIITFAASASLASTKCTQKFDGGRFANTNPVAVKAVKTVAASSQVGVR